MPMYVAIENQLMKKINDRLWCRVSSSSFCVDPSCLADKNSNLLADLYIIRCKHYLATLNSIVNIVPIELYSFLQYLYCEGYFPKHIFRNHTV